MENLSLFETPEEGSDLLTNNAVPEGLNVVRAEFVQAEYTTWIDLFSGYDNLYAITFSSGISFVARLLKQFKSAEIIFGCEDVMSYSIQEVMAFQSMLITSLRKAPGIQQQTLIDRIKGGSLRLYAARGKLSHEKIYLLSAEDGRKRVIMGSANMSYNAFSGRQRENIIYIDGDAAYDHYMDCYEELKESSTDQIEQSAILVADNDEHVDELPVSRTIKTKKVLVIEPQTVEQKENVLFALDVKNLAKKFKTAVPAPDKNGKVLLSPEKVRTIKRQVVLDAAQEKEFRSERPHLRVDTEKQIVTLNGEQVNLNPSHDEISHDVQLFLCYMDGYKKFHGNIEALQRRYYEFANWFFCSPFMAVMRDTAHCYKRNLTMYPAFGLIYGQSKAGKTTFLKTLLKMMIAQTPTLRAKEFTQSDIAALRNDAEGAPIIIDDLMNDRFSRHAKPTIKDEDFGFDKHNIYYPAVVFSANEDVKAVEQEFSRRMVVCHVEAGLTNTEIIKSTLVESVQSKIGTAFYREYLRQMLGFVPELLEQFCYDVPDAPMPDILAVSSRVLKQIICEHTAEEIPDYIRELSIDDYIGECVTGRNAINTIRTAWKVNRRAFTVDARRNELLYRVERGRYNEIKDLKKELPETLVPKESGTCLIMKLDAACEFFDIDFRHKWIEMFRFK